MLKMKNKTIVISQYDDLENPFYGGGGAYAVHEIAMRLAKENYVTVVTFNFKGAGEIKKDGVRYVRMGPSFLGPKFGQLLYHLLLPFAVRMSKHDLWIESFTPPFSTSLTPLFTRKPVIGLVHMLTGADMRRKYKFPFDYLEKLGLKTYKYFMVLNKFDKSRIASINPGAQIEIIQNGITLPRNTKNGEKKHLLFLGRIEINQKGIDLLLKAYSENQSAIKLPLVIAGSGSDKEEAILRKNIDRLGLSKRIFLKGRVEGNRKSKLFREALFCVIPSRYETFSIVGLEAISYGLPVVSFDIKGLSWMPRRCRLVAQKFNWRKMGELMKKMSQDAQLRRVMSQEARREARNYSWEKIYKRYENYLTKIA